MTCSSFRRHYSAFRDALEPGRDALMHEHLEACEPCRTRHRALDVGVRMLRTQHAAGLDRPARPLHVLVQTELAI